MSPPNKDKRGPPEGRGPPPWANNYGSKVEEQKDGSLKVGKSGKEKAEEQALNADNQQDRIEAKLDLLLTELRDR
jgi:hypothetical protein